jgi:carbonic anhydrase
MPMSSLPSVREDEKFRQSLVELRSRDDIPQEWIGTPIEAFIMSQNFCWPIQPTGKPEMLITTCIEFRYALPVPRMYAYVIRRASGRIIGSEFSVAYTMSKGVKCLAMIGHNDCGMTKVPEATPDLIRVLVNQGWDPQLAEQYVVKHGARHAIDDEIEALKQEYRRMRSLFPKLLIAPLFVCLYDSKLYLPRWYAEVTEDEKKNPRPDHVPDEIIQALP